MSLLLLAAAAVAGLLLEERGDAVAIVSIVVLNAVIAFVQEGRAASALEALQALEVATASVIRRGRPNEVATRDVVVGDLLVLRAGSRVPADARVVEASNLEVDESLLTGESFPVPKTIEQDRSAISIADRRAMVFSGTLITRGGGRAIATATGMGTELGTIAGQIQKRVSSTPLQRELKSVAVRIGLATVVIALFVVALLAVRGGGETDLVEHAFLVGVALAVAAVPEGLAAVTTVTLALGVRRMAERGGIVRRLAAVETLGSTGVLAIDKTGTVTENRMSVAHIVDPSGHIASLSEVPVARRRLMEEIECLCNDATLDPPSGDPLEIALLEAAGLSRVREIRRGNPRVATLPFDAERKCMTTVHRRGQSFLVATKGAPEVVVALCTGGLADDGSKHQPDRSAIAGAAAALAADGYRIIALAQRDLESFTDDGARIESDLALVALVALEDPIRKEAAGAVAEARAAGVRVVMVTGDHPSTAITVARRIGLSEGAPEVLTGSDLRSSGVPSDPLTVDVYARVDPDQKLEIVKRLQDNGHVVGVTGDGVNDAPALRRADIGVALGRSGTDVAREAGDLIITDDNLSTIVSAIREGRGIYANIRKVVDYLLACNASEVITVLLVLVAFPSVGLPLLPLQLLWMNLVTDGLPALALGMDPADPSLMREPPRAPTERLLDKSAAYRLGSRGLVLAISSVIALAAVRYGLHAPWAQARAAAFTVLVWGQLIHAFTARREAVSLISRISPVSLIASIRANTRLTAAVALGALLQVGVVSWRPAGRILGVSPFGVTMWLVAIAAAALGALLMAALPTFTGRRLSPPARLQP